MEMEAAHPDHSFFFLSPSPHHLAELRIDPPHSAVAFSAPARGATAAGRKRRCLLPAASHRKKMLLELHPFFGSPRSPSPSPPPSPCRPPATAPPLLPRRAGFPASEFSFASAVAWNGRSGGGGGGGGGGNIFALAENTPTTPPPAGSNASAVSFLASPGQPTTPTGSSASGVFAFLTSPKQPTTPTGSSASGVFAFVTSPKQPTTPTGPTPNGGFVFTASPEQPPTPTGSPADGGLAPLPSWPSPKHARTGSTDSGGFAFFPSPGPAIGHTGSTASPAFVFSASRESAPPVRQSGGGSNKRSRRHLGVATARRRSLGQWEVAQQDAPPPQKVAKTGALATGEASRSSIQSGSSAKQCCTFFTSPAKTSKQDAKKASSEASRGSASPAGSRVTSPARKQEREVEVSSVAREGPAPTSLAACHSAEVMVRVTCTCGVQKEFSFDHCH